MSNHAKLSPSSANRWKTCTGSITLTNELVDRGYDILDDKPNEYADLGTLAHSALEFALKHPQVGDIGDLLVEMGKHIKESQEYVKQLQTKDSITLVEARVDMFKDCWGTADVIVYDYNARTIHVVDLKYGKSRVKVSHNDQLLLYAYGALKAPEAIVVDGEWEKIVLHIMQPRLHNGFSSWETTPKEVKKAAKEAKKAAKKIAKGEVEFVYDNHHCYFCPAKGYCDEFAKAQSVFQDLTAL